VPQAAPFCMCQRLVLASFPTSLPEWHMPILARPPGFPRSKDLLTLVAR